MYKSTGRKEHHCERSEVSTRGPVECMWLHQNSKMPPLIATAVLALSFTLHASLWLSYLYANIQSLHNNQWVLTKSYSSDRFHEFSKSHFPWSSTQFFSCWLNMHLSRFNPFSARSRWLPCYILPRMDLPVAKDSEQRNLCSLWTSAL